MLNVNCAELPPIGAALTLMNCVRDDRVPHEWTNNSGISYALHFNLIIYTLILFSTL